MSAREVGGGIKTGCDEILGKRAEWHRFVVGKTGEAFGGGHGCDFREEAFDLLLSRGALLPARQSSLLSL